MYARIILYIIAGNLMASGWINDELRMVLTTDEEVAAAVQVALAGIVSGISWAWWRLAKRFGWKT